MSTYFIYIPKTLSGGPMYIYFILEAFYRGPGPYEALWASPDLGPYI